MKKSFMQIVLKRQIFITSVLILLFLFLSNYLFEDIYEQTISEPVIQTITDGATSFQENWNEKIINFQDSYVDKIQKFFLTISESVSQADEFSSMLLDDTLHITHLINSREIQEINWYIISDEGIVVDTNMNANLGFDFSESTPRYWKSLSKLQPGEIFVDKIMYEMKTNTPAIYGYYKLDDGYILELGIKFKEVVFEEFNNKLKSFIDNSIYIQKISFYTLDFNPFFVDEEIQEEDKILFKSVEQTGSMHIKRRQNNAYSIYTSSKNYLNFDELSYPLIRTKIELDFSKLMLIKNRFVTLFNVFIIILFCIVVSINFGFTRKLVSNLKSIINKVHDFEKNPKNGLGNLDKHNDFKETEELGNAFKIMAHKLTTMFKDQENINKTLEVANDKLELLASHDDLTGVENRRTFYKKVQILLDNKTLHWSLVFIDMDKLKTVNDVFGHNIGDKALYTIGKTFAEYTRNQDHISRIGGDEFVMALVNIDETQAEKIMQRINSALLKRGKEINRDLKLSISYGIYTVTDNEDKDIETIIQIADSRMYKYKKNKAV